MKSNPEPGHYLMNNDAFVFFSRLLFSWNKPALQLNSNKL
jgi:hypothetical protein